MRKTPSKMVKADLSPQQSASPVILGNTLVH